MAREEPVKADMRRRSDAVMTWGAYDASQGAVVVTVPDRDTLLADLAARLGSRQGFTVATLNLDHVVKLRRDSAFCDAYAAHTHVTADGNPIVWLSRLAGQETVSLTPGSELIEPLVSIAAGLRLPVGFFGSTQASLQTAAAVLQARHPGLQVAYCNAPSMGFDPEGPAADAAINVIGASGVRLVFLALGAPKQERFAARAQEVLPQVGFVSIGAGLDFISGAQTRAPSWVRTIAAEWLWRLVNDPRRLAGRYASCAAVLPKLTLRALRARSGVS